MIKQRSSREIAELNNRYKTGAATLETVWFILAVGMFMLICWLVVINKWRF
jgi:hypothetical protein